MSKNENKGKNKETGKVDGNTQVGNSVETPYKEEAPALNVNIDKVVEVLRLNGVYGTNVGRQTRIAKEILAAL